MSDHRYTTLPELIRGRCRALRMTQRRLAEEMGRRGLPTHENTISIWATGLGRPEADRLEVLLDALDVYGEVRRAIVYRLTYAPEGVDIAPLELPAQGGQS